MILPSTRITLFEPTTSELEHAGGEGDKEREVNEPPDEKAVSTTARTLIETVRLLRNHSRCAVSRAFVLSGPPGVGKV